MNDTAKYMCHATMDIGGIIGIEISDGRINRIVIFFRGQYKGEIGDLGK